LAKNISKRKREGKCPGIAYLPLVIVSEPRDDQRPFHFENGYKRKSVYLTFVTGL